jgi:hypothetical protein
MPVSLLKRTTRVSLEFRRPRVTRYILQRRRISTFGGLLDLGDTRRGISHLGPSKTIAVPRTAKWFMPVRLQASQHSRQNSRTLSLGQRSLWKMTIT